LRDKPAQQHHVRKEMMPSCGRCGAAHNGMKPPALSAPILRTSCAKFSTRQMQFDFICGSGFFEAIFFVHLTWKIYKPRSARRTRRKNEDFSLFQLNIFVTFVFFVAKKFFGATSPKCLFINMLRYQRVESMNNSG